MSEREEFLQALDPEATYFTFQTFPELPSSPNWPRLLCGSLSVVEHTLLHLNSEGSGIFVAVNVFPHGASRRIENFERARAVWLDWDHKLEPLPDTWPLDPHIIVNTSPGKYHVYWRCEDMPISDHWAIEKALVKLGHDPNACDIARVLRVPGFVNFKDPANPYQSSLLFNRKGRPYSREELFRAFDVSSPEPTPAPDPKPIAADTGSYDLILTQICTQSALKTRSEVSVGRHAQLYWVGRRMRESGLPNDPELFQKAFDMCREWYRPTDTQGEMKPFKPSEVKTISDGYGKGGDGVGVKMTDPGGGSAQRPNTTYGGAADAMRDHREEGSAAPISVHDYSNNHERINQDFEPDWTTISELMPECVQRLVDAHERAAHKCQPELAIGAALATLSLPLMRRYRTASDAPLALFQLGIADTGEGKEMGRRLIRVVASEGEHEARLAGEYASASAVQWRLRTHPAHLSLLDEFGKYLGFTKKDAGAHSAAALARLMEFFNAHQGRHEMTSYSKLGTTVEDNSDSAVFAPTIGLYAVSTPQTMFEALSSKEVADGLLNRFLVTITRQPVQALRWNIRPLRCPPATAQWMRRVRDRWAQDEDYAHIVRTDDATKPCHAIQITESQKALAQFILLDERKTALIKENPAAQRFFVRTVEKARRIAAIIALGENSEAVAVQSPQAEWACAMAWTCDLELMRIAEDRIADSEQESLVKRVLRLIRRQPGISHSELVRRTWWTKNGQREDILFTLLQSELIVIREVQTAAGRTVKEYEAI